MLYDILQKLDIVYEEVNHQRVYTIEEAQKAGIRNLINGVGCKNLFLTDHKDHYYLVVLEENKKIHIKDISQIVGAHLSFASPERLKEILGLESGSVSPFGIINDNKNKTIIIIDKELKNQKLLFHPNRNDKTINIEYNDLIKFIKYLNHNYQNI